MRLGTSYALLWVAAGVVILGIILEELTIFRDVSKIYHEFRANGSQSAIERIRKKGWLFGLEKIGFVMLVVGLAAELGLQAHVELRDAMLKRNSDTKIAFLQDDEKIKDRQIAEANADAQRARLEAEQLKETVKWRTITPDQLSILANELAKGSGSVTIAFLLGDPEAQMLAFAIVNAFLRVDQINPDAKWRRFFEARTYPAQLFFGISIPGPDNPQVLTIRHAFEKANIPFSTEDIPEPPPPIPTGGGLIWTPPQRKEALIMIGLRAPSF